MNIVRAIYRYTIVTNICWFVCQTNIRFCYISNGSPFP
nr:MAG TPA: hypothetical protein [Caudoviricetes sp.]